MSDSQYSFQNINIIENIEKSFSEFLIDKQIQYPNLSNKKLEEWDFEKYLDKNNILPLNLEKFPALIDSIPNLSNVKENNDNQLKLIKFFGTIQNVFENQLYISAKYDLKNKKYLPNKYFENNSNVIKIEDDNLGNKSGIDILGDRLRLELIPVIGINEYFDKNYDLKTDNHQKIIVYDYSNKFTKINQNILVIGVAYEKNDMIIIHCWKIIENYEKIKICKDSYSLINITENKNMYREKLKNILSKSVKNDKLATEYILLFLFSQIFAKIGTKNVGSFPLNLILDENNDINKCNDIYSNILSIFRKFCCKTKDIKLTTDELNNKLFYPRFDGEIEELCPGKLQLSDGTFLIVDEINMNEGKLIDVGVKNVAALKSLIDFQLLGYEYPYNKIEISHDIEVLIVSYKAKSILYSPFLTLLPMIPSNDNNGDNEAYVLSESDFKHIFYYINFIRYDSSFNDKFAISNEISNSIQKNYFENNPKFKADDFDLVLKLSRFHALSYGRNFMTYEDYEYVVYLENQRKERINSYNNKKK